MSVKSKRVRVTTLTINPDDIKWATLQEKFHLYRYKVPKKQFTESNSSYL